MAIEAPTETELERRILDAALRLVARWGVGKTTIADIGREAGCSRASVYRAFPGGKHELFVRLGRSEFQRFFEMLTARVDSAETFEDALTDLVVSASAGLAAHDALQFVLAHEPGLVLPFLGFNQVDRLYEGIRKTLGPHLERFVAVDGDAAWAAEWSARVVLSFAFDRAGQADLSDPVAARRLVTQFLLPALSQAQRG